MNDKILSVPGGGETSLVSGRGVLDKPALADTLQAPVQEQGDVFVLKSKEVNMILSRIKNEGFKNSVFNRSADGFVRIGSLDIQFNRFVITSDRDGNIGLFSRPGMIIRHDEKGIVEDYDNMADTFPKVLDIAQKENPGKQIIMNGCGYVYYDYQTNTFYFWGESLKFGGFDQQVVKEIIKQFGDSINIAFENPIK